MGKDIVVSVNFIIKNKTTPAHITKIERLQISEDVFKLVSVRQDVLILEIVRHFETNPDSFVENESGRCVFWVTYPISPKNVSKIRFSSIIDKNKMTVYEVE